MILHLHIVWNDHPVFLTSVTIHSYRIFFLVMRTFKICSPSNFQLCSTVLLATAIMLYIISTVNFITGQLYLLTPFTHFAQPPAHLWKQPICSPYLWAWFCFFLCLFLDSIYVSEVIQYMSFIVWLNFTLHNAFKVHLCCCKWKDFFFLLAE